MSVLNIECDRKIIRYSVKTCNHPSQERHTLRNNPIHQIVSSSRTLTRFTQKLHQSLAIIKNESTWILRNNTARSNTDLTTRVGKKRNTTKMDHYTWDTDNPNSTLSNHAKITLSIVTYVIRVFDRTKKGKRSFNDSFCCNDRKSRYV